MQGKNLVERTQMEATVKLRSKVHSQTFGAYEAGKYKHSLTQTGKLALAQTNDLVQLRVEYQRTFNPSLKIKARQLLRTLPLFSVDEDRNLQYSQRALRVAAFFGITDTPAVHAILSMHTQHSYLLDTQAMGSFFSILARLQHKETAEIVRIMLPRLKEVSDDMTVQEISAVLDVLSQCGMTDTELVRQLTATVVHTVDDTALWTVVSCARILASFDVDAGKQVLQSAETRLIDDILCNQATGEVIRTILGVCRASAILCWAPRHLQNAVARRTLELISHFTPEQLGTVARAFHRTSYRHERLLRMLATHQASRTTEQTVNSAITTISSLAHFVLLDDEVASALLAPVSSNMNNENLASILRSCSRCQVRCASVLAGPIERCVQSPPTELKTTLRICFGLTSLRAFSTPEDAQALLKLLEVAHAQRFQLQVTPEAQRNILDITRVLLTECKHRGLRDMVPKLNTMIGVPN